VRADATHAKLFGLGFSDESVRIYHDLFDRPITFRDVGRMLDGRDRNGLWNGVQKVAPRRQIEKGVSLLVQWDCRERLPGARHRSLWLQAEDDILLEGFD
jgi:hypothetical protein